MLKAFENITVLDISAKSLEKAKARLGKNVNRVNWIVSNITEFEPNQTYDIWHDRAVFHFLISAGQIKTYLKIARKAVSGFMTIGTFSENGPEKCSGLEIKQHKIDHTTVHLIK